MLGLRPGDVSAGERPLCLGQRRPSGVRCWACGRETCPPGSDGFAEGKGGHQRRVPVSPRFFTTLAAYLAEERPDSDNDRVFVVLKKPRRGRPLSAYGLDQVVEDARGRAGSTGSRATS